MDKIAHYLGEVHVCRSQCDGWGVVVEKGDCGWWSSNLISMPFAGCLIMKWLSQGQVEAFCLLQYIGLHFYMFVGISLAIWFIVLAFSEGGIKVAYNS